MVSIINSVATVLTLANKPSISLLSKIPFFCKERRIVFEIKPCLANIENGQKKYLKNFEIKENQLKKKLKVIEDSKLMLNEAEINLQINDYNNELANFRIRVEEFNNHYKSQILKIRETILGEIIQLLEKYAITNNVDLILDSTTYLIASNTLDITELINEELKKLNFELEYKDFEEN